MKRILNFFVCWLCHRRWCRGQYFRDTRRVQNRSIGCLWFKPNQALKLTKGDMWLWCQWIAAFQLHLLSVAATDNRKPSAPKLISNILPLSILLLNFWLRGTQTGNPSEVQAVARSVYCEDDIYMHVHSSVYHGSSASLMLTEAGALFEV